MVGLERSRRAQRARRGYDGTGAQGNWVFRADRVFARRNASAADWRGPGIDGEPSPLHRAFRGRGSAVWVAGTVRARHGALFPSANPGDLIFAVAVSTPASG